MSKETETSLNELFRSYAPQAIPSGLKFNVNPITLYDAQVDIEAALANRGDTQHGDKWGYWHSSTKKPNITVRNNLMVSLDADDPLNDGRAHGSFDVLHSDLNVDLEHALIIAWNSTGKKGGQTIEQIKSAGKVKQSVRVEADIDTDNTPGDGVGDTTKNKIPNGIIAKLAALPRIEYEALRKDIAKKYDLRCSVLDMEVVKEIKANTQAEEMTAVEKLEPYFENVDGAELLDEIAETIKKHVFLPNGVSDAIAVWCLGSFCMEAWQLWPKCLITSPEKRCGKTTLIEVMEGLTFQALVASNISPAAIFRCIDAWSPTLFLDEADTFAKDNPEMNGIMNAGHKRRTANVIRCEKEYDKHQPKMFSVWAPQVIAGIGTQRETLHDRSIHIEMIRKLPDEKVTKVPVNFFEEYRHIREKCLRWAKDNAAKLRHMHPTIPNYGNDRAQDNWQPLCAIGQIAGAGWLYRVLASYKAVESSAERDEDAGILLLRDIQTILEAGRYRSLASSVLVEKLIKIEDSPWGEWRRGQPMTQNSLSRLLKPFKIKPKQLRINGNKTRGFEAEQFKETFQRYIPSVQTGTPVQTSCGTGSSGFTTGTEKTSVPVVKCQKHSPDAGCTGVPVAKGVIETEV